MRKNRRIFLDKKGRKWKRIMGILLAMAVVLNTLPSGWLVVSASENKEVFYLACDENGKNWTTETITEYTEVTSNTTTWSDGWYVVSGEITISSNIMVSGTVCLILTENCTLNAEKGITVNEGNVLTIYAQSESEKMGKLTATGGDGHSAGIGANYGAGGTITINGGNITANGGAGGGNAGIGGGSAGYNHNDKARGGIITINGGIVTANGSSGGASAGAGIGGAYYGTGGTITINGGTVKATGGNCLYGAAGIGGGNNSSGDSTIIINGGFIEAYSGGNSDGIGNGHNGSGGTVTISGGIVTAKGEGRDSDINANNIITGGMVNGTTYYAVTFDTNRQDGIIVPTKGVASGGTVTKPDVKAEGWKLIGWYTDKSCTTLFSFSVPITGDTTLYAKWEKCSHEWNFTNNSDETHTLNCFDCGSTEIQHHTFETSSQCICGAEAVAQVEKDKELTYVATLAEAFADSNNGATVTLLQDVTLSEAVIIDYDFTLDLNGHTISDSGNCSNYLLRVGQHWESNILVPANVAICGSGSVLGNPDKEAGSSVLVGGNLTLEGGFFSGGTYGVRLMGDLASLTVTSEDVYISTLCINSNKSGKAVTLTAGTYSNIIVVRHTLADLLGEGYAYYDTMGKPLVLSGLGDTEDGVTTLASSVTVRKCEHKGVEYNSNKNSTHSMTCPYCGYTKEAEKCNYSFSGNVGICQDCKSTLTVSVTGTENLIYDNTEKKPAVTVKVDGETSLTEDTDYELSYTNNINAGDNASVTVTGKTFNGSFTQKFSIKKATPDIGKVTAQELENTFAVSKEVLNREKTVPAGTLKLADGSTLQYGTKTYTWEFTPEDTMNYLTITGKVDITVKDTMAPTANYQIGTDGWKKFIKTISFGLFCKDYKTVKIEFTDDTDTVKGSGVAKKQYYIADKEITTFDNMEWKDYTETIYLNAKGTYFIYVKVTDHAGNEAILNSEGIVIYEESLLSPTAFDYTYRQNKDLALPLTMNGNTLKTLEDNKGNVVEATNYTVEDGKMTLKGAYLDTLDKGEYIYKIYMNPQGVETDKVTLAYTFTVRVKAKELTVTSVTATNREYNGTNTVEITAIALNGIVSNDDVSVDLNGIQGVVSSSQAGEYDSVTLPKLTLTGTSKSNYTLIQPEKAVTTSVSIEKASTKITVETDTYRKIYGDEAFILDVTDNSPEKDVQYKVTAGEEIVSVENGTVIIKNAGTATITVSLPESANYKAATDKTITVNVAKKSGYTVEEVNKSYFCTKENADTVDLAALLPKDCGTVTYKEPATSGDVTVQTPAVKDGKLSYTLGSGSANNEGVITVTAETQNYEDITITVNVKLTDKIPVSIKEGMEVTWKGDILNYGEALSKLVLDDVDFVDSDGNKVEGTLVWKNGEAIPGAGTTSAAWIFSPTNDSKYEILEGIAIITVKKAIPEISEIPAVTDMVYNPAITLKDIVLTGTTESVQGSWSWERANIVPSVGNSGYVAVFTPTDKTNYETVKKTIVVNVTKATPYIETAPSAAVITYGDTLGVSNLAGGVVQYSKDTAVKGYDTTVSGSFAWKDGSRQPAAAGSNTYPVVFTPADGVNYHSVEATVTLTVEKAENAPDMPGSTMDVLNSCEKVSDVDLPNGWEWQAADKDTVLEVGVGTNVVAIYVGADKGNYEKEMVTVVLTRSSCEHVAGGILYTGEGEKAPTCTENGLGHKECTKCHSLVETGIVVTALGHIHTELRGAAGATCTAGGYTGDSYCKDCGARVAGGTATGKLAHNYTSAVTKEPTTTEEGVRTYTCLGCGSRYTEVIAKLAEEEHKHSYSLQITKEATCTEEGTATYGCTCGDNYTESIPALNHSYISEVTKEPTATEEGVRTYTCTRCGNRYTEAIAKLAEEEHKHNYSLQIVKEATCTEEGTATYHCACGDSYTENIPVLNHSYTSEVTKEPTTTEEGVRTYTCTRCGDNYTEAVAKLAEEEHKHSYSSQITKEATCTEEGTATYSCACGDSYTESIPALNHSYTDWKSDEINHWRPCSRCGDKSEESNHNFGSWVVVKQPTEEKEGVRERDCTVCGYRQTEQVAKKKTEDNDKEKQEKNSLTINAGLKVSQTGSQINIAWGKVSGASGYDVYVQYCGTKFNTKSLNQVKGGTKTKTTVKKVNGKKPDLKKNYKVYVVAYKLKDGKKVTLGKSITAHIVGRNSKKYTNVKSITVKKNSYTLKKGKTANIQAKTVLVSKNKKELSNAHAKKFRYASSNQKVATVSANGKIKAAGKGSCIIYIYARNGYAKKVKVTVK